MFKKFMVALFISAVSFGISHATSVEIQSLNAKNEFVTLSVPLDPKRVAVADMASLDSIDALGFGDRVVAMTKAQSVPYLKDYNDNPNIANIGSVKEVDIEKLMMAKPDIIFIGSRLANQYDKFSKIAPVVYLGVDYKTSTFQSIKHNIHTIATIFGKKDDMDAKFDEFKNRLEAIKEASKDKTAILALVTSSSLHTLGDEKRCAMITTDAGFNNLAKDAKTTHGNDSSFELVLKLNPDYIFVLDRDSAISTRGAKLAKDVMNNEIINKTKAANEGHIYYLNPPVWYLSEGGITALDLMLKDLESALNISK
ncbi:MAG: ABC transporter substrate-binding protein [Campylobacter sp.]|nr:ABC transporter substrate-binding protein [Campylobacter sp.]